MTSTGEGTVLLYLTHSLDIETRQEFERISLEGFGNGRTYLLCDTSQCPKVDGIEGSRLHPFDGQTVGSDRYPRLSPGLLQHAHFPVLDFFRKHPDFDFYWVVEWDVRFTGHWGRFFNAFSGLAHDLVTCHIRAQHEEPDWPWWSLEHPVEVIPLHERLRSLNVIYRMSRRALGALDGWLESGWKGHYEVSFPTLLFRKGYSLADIGGSGSFVLPGFRNRFYKSADFKNGRLKWFGTVNFRPIRNAPGNRPDTLYHPVKPGSIDPVRYPILPYPVRVIARASETLPAFLGSTAWRMNLAQRRLRQRKSTVLQKT